MADIAKYYQGETYQQKAHVTDADSADTDPTTIKITIEDSTGIKKITTTDMTKDSLGYYHYNYDIPSDAEVGQWITEVIAEKTQIAIEHDAFIVMEAL